MALDEEWLYILLKYGLIFLRLSFINCIWSCKDGEDVLEVLQTVFDRSVNKNKTELNIERMY